MDLADKYDVSPINLRAKLLHLVERDWPSTLVEWDANEAQIRCLSQELDKTNELHPLDDRLPDPTHAIRFAHTYALSAKSIQKIPSYIPAAFYHLGRLPPFADRDDITLSSADFVDGIDGLRTAQRSLLSHQDMMCLLNGIYNIRLEAARIAFVGFIEEATNFASAEETEKETMITWWRKVGMEMIVGPERLDILSDLKALADLLGTAELNGPEMRLLCQGTKVVYRDAMRAYLMKERETQWKLLDHHFTLYSFFY